MTEKTNALTQAAMKLGEAMYKAQQAEAQTEASPDAAGAESAGEEKPADEDVVDAEFSEVDEENKGE
jgi:molecular chaperone DnaK